MKTLKLNCFTNSEWDCCEFAEIEITEETLSTISKVRNKIMNENIERLSSVNVFSNMEVFVDENNPIEQKLDVCEMRIDSWSVYWVSFGKHTNEEFYTDSINIDELFKMYDYENK